MFVLKQGGWSEVANHLTLIKSLFDWKAKDYLLKSGIFELYSDSFRVTEEGLILSHPCPKDSTLITFLLSSYLYSPLSPCRRRN